VIELHPDIRKKFTGKDAFDRILAIRGEVFRNMDGRKTLRFTLNGKRYFIKMHFGVGWKIIFKDLARLHFPTLSARTERLAITRLEELGVDTMKIVGYGEQGWNPARLKSFIITEELENTISLEDFCREWASRPPGFTLKQALIAEVAHIARRLHENGMNHRDFYICHFLLDRDSGKYTTDLRQGRGDEDNPRVFLIDLHRVQIRRRTPKRWIIKDLAGLYFSSMDIGLNRRDILRFMKIYRGKSLREVLTEEEGFWRRVNTRAIKLYKKIFGRLPNPIFHNRR
jgi:heptose I phosphotransferase